MAKDTASCFSGSNRFRCPPVTDGQTDTQTDNYNFSIMIYTVCRTLRINDTCASFKRESTVCYISTSVEPLQCLQVYGFICNFMEIHELLRTKMLNWAIFQKVKIYSHGILLINLDGFLDKISLFPDDLARALNLWICNGS